MKIIGIVLCILSTSTIGIYYAGRVYERFKILRQIEDMVILLKNEIEYTKDEISEAFYYISKRTKGCISDMLMELSDKTKENNGILEEIWAESVMAHLKDTCLEVKDIKELSSLGKNMGYLGMDMQKVNFTKYISYLSDEIKDTKENMDKTARFYKMMGIMSGIGISILLI